MSLKISVAICTYNGALFIKEQLNSILLQTLPVNEIIICDDGSTDNTINIINELMLLYPNIIQLYKNEYTLGAKKNFEKAILLCKGDYIFLSDQDDIWDEEKVKICINYLENNSELIGVFTNAKLINESGISCYSKNLWEYASFPMAEINKENLYSYILKFGNIVTGANLVIKKEALRLIIPFQFLENVWHDEWIAICLSSLGRLGILDKCLTYYRMHPNQQVGISIFNPNNNYLAKYHRVDLLIHEVALDNFFFWKNRLTFLYQLQPYAIVPDFVLDYVTEYMHLNLKYYLRSLPWSKRKILMLKWKMGGLYPFKLKELLLY